MGKRWRIQPHDPDLVSKLERSTGVAPVVAQLLVSRGVYESQEVRTFLDAKLSGLRDPDLLPGARGAAERIWGAIQAGRRIIIYGDYDADGMTGTAILYLCVRMLGGNVGYYVPNRLEEGYGLNSEALRLLHSRDASLVVSVDCGIGSVQEAETAREIGLELIITDHHEPGSRLPAAPIVHPRLPGTAYPFGELCGAGVAFKLAWALCQQASGAKRVADRMRSYLLCAVGLAALGTVADVVPLLDENRILVRHGLASLLARPMPGIRALIELTGLDRKPFLAAEDIAFTLAPRLNAAGRLGQAQLGVELLTTESTERARALAEYLHELNNSRDSLERSIHLAATRQLKEEFDPEGDPAFVLSGVGWHPGVIGIVAGRLAEKYNRPVVLLSQDQLGAKPATGSARSACGFNLHQAFIACSRHLLAHGGHAAAAGLKIEESNIDAFRSEFCEYAAAEISTEARVPEVRIDAEAPLSQLTLQTVHQIEQLAPFGNSNPRPVLCASGVRLTAPAKRIGGGERHLSARFVQHRVALRAVGFGHGDWVDELPETDQLLDIAYRPVINEYAGLRSVELHLVDWRRAAQPAVPPPSAVSVP